MNNITIIGNLCREPSVRTTQNGKRIVNITVAVASSRKDETDFFNCICYEPISNFVANYLTKGCKVAINGTCHIKEFEKKDGSKGKDIEIDVRTLENLTPKPKDDKDIVVDPLPIADEDLPF